MRKTHNGGRKHREMVRLYYQTWMEEQAQKLVDMTARAFKEGKIASNPLMSVVRPPAGAMIPPPAHMIGMPQMGMPQGIGMVGCIVSFRSLTSLQPPGAIPVGAIPPPMPPANWMQPGMPGPPMY